MESKPQEAKRKQRQLQKSSTAGPQSQIIRWESTPDKSPYRTFESSCPGANWPKRASASGPRLVALLCVVACPEKMERHVRLFAHDTTVMRKGRDVEQMSRNHFDFSSIIECGHGPARNDHPNMFNNASLPMSGNATNRELDGCFARGTRIYWPLW